MDCLFPERYNLKMNGTKPNIAYLTLKNITEFIIKLLEQILQTLLIYFVKGEDEGRLKNDQIRVQACFYR